jgi:hypothetical protein
LDLVNDWQKEWQTFLVNVTAILNFRAARQPLGMFKAVPHAFLYTEQGPVRWVR